MSGNGEARAAGPLAIISWSAAAVALLLLALGLVALDGAAPFIAGFGLACFAAGCVAFLVAYAVAIGRSRYEQPGIAGLYFLAGSAPARVRRSFNWALGCQSAIAVVAVASKPYSSLVYLSLVPMLGLGLTGLWGARNGQFPPKQQAPPKEPG